jgi:hypothetical protein
MLDWHAPVEQVHQPSLGLRPQFRTRRGIGDDGTQYVFFRGGNNHVYQAFHNSNDWHGPINMCTSHHWGCGVSSAHDIAKSQG